MLLKIRPEIHYLEGEHQKTDVYKKKPDQEPSVEGQDQNSSAYKNSTRIPINLERTLICSISRT